MTKKQEEAIETVKTYLHDWRDSLTDEDGYGAIVEEYDIEFINAVETVLNMLKEKDKQIDLITEFLEERDLGYYKKEDGGEILGMMRIYNKDDWKQYFEELAGRKSKE